jgi:hypothetical protein
MAAFAKNWRRESLAPVALHMQSRYGGHHEVILALD